MFGWCSFSSGFGGAGCPWAVKLYFWMCLSGVGFIGFDFNCLSLIAVYRSEPFGFSVVFTLSVTLFSLTGAGPLVSCFLGARTWQWAISFPCFVALGSV